MSPTSTLTFSPRAPDAALVLGCLLTLVLALSILGAKFWVRKSGQARALFAKSVAKATMSFAVHEARNVLQGMIMAVEDVAREDTRAALYQGISNAVATLQSSLVTEAWLEGNPPRVLRQRVNVAALLRSSAQRVVPMLRRNTPLRVDAWSGHAFAAMPRMLVEGALFNFLSNAAKFSVSHAGHIDMCAMPHEGGILFIVITQSRLPSHHKIPPSMEAIHKRLGERRLVTATFNDSVQEFACKCARTVFAAEDSHFTFFVNEADTPEPAASTGLGMYFVRVVADAIGGCADMAQLDPHTVAAWLYVPPAHEEPVAV